MQASWIILQYLTLSLRCCRGNLASSFFYNSVRRTRFDAYIIPFKRVSKYVGSLCFWASDWPSRSWLFQSRKELYPVELFCIFIMTIGCEGWPCRPAFILRPSGMYGHSLAMQHFSCILEKEGDHLKPHIRLFYKKKVARGVSRINTA